MEYRMAMKSVLQTDFHKKLSQTPTINKNNDVSSVQKTIEIFS